MYRLFTLPEATSLLPVVDMHFTALQDAAADVTKLQAAAASGPRGGVDMLNHMREIAFLVDVINSNKAELDRLGVMIRDVDAGLVDFPSRLAGEVVCLTWTKGEDAITHYHPLSGDAGIRPLPTPASESPRPARTRAQA